MAASPFNVGDLVRFVNEKNKFKVIDILKIKGITYYNCEILSDTERNIILSSQDELEKVVEN